MKLSDIRENLEYGDQVKVITDFGSGPTVIAEYQELEYDDSRECEVINYVYNGEGFWCYPEQIVARVEV